MTSGCLGLIAGSGRYPVLLAKRLRERGEDLVVAGIHGHASAEAFAPYSFRNFYPGEVGAVCEWFQRNQAAEAVLAGGFQWPRKGVRLKPDWSVWPRLPLLMLCGDDRRLRCVAALLERRGVSIVGARPWIGDWFVPKGIVCGPEPGDALQSLIDLGITRCRAFVRSDKGQAVCVSSGGTVTYENRQGTDALMIGMSRAGGVLVKMNKVSQDTRFDVPTIGPSTVDLAARVGIRAIVVEADAVMLLEKESVIHKCREANISLLSV